VEMGVLLKDGTAYKLVTTVMLGKPLRDGNVLVDFFTHTPALNYEDRRSTVTSYLNEKSDELSLKIKFLLLVLT
jgi:hypothetical protein